MQPPKEELLEGQDVCFVCYDLECTGLSLQDELVQLAACSAPVSSAATSSFSCYVVPPTKRVCSSAAKVIGLQVVAGTRGRALVDTRTGLRLPAVGEQEALLTFLDWLRQVRGDHDGVVLVSHGAILLDIPVLLLALRRNCLVDEFRQVVFGFSDSNGVFRRDKRITKYSLQDLYERFVGHRAQSHRAQEDAADLYAVLLKYFETSTLSLRITALARYTYTTECMLQYVAWQESVDPHRQPLYAVLSHWNKRSVKLRNELVRNLLAAGHSLEGLRELYDRLGTSAFKAHLQRDIVNMKALYESYLTDTGDLPAETVARVVTTYFQHTK